MRRLLKIFQGKIHASQEPSCWPRIAPRGPTTVKGFEGTASRTILRGTLSSNGKLAKTAGWSLVWPIDCGFAVSPKNKARAAAKAEFTHSPVEKSCGNAGSSYWGAIGAEPLSPLRRPSPAAANAAAQQK